jgi:hypothetical protein
MRLPVKWEEDQSERINWYENETNQSNPSSPEVVIAKKTARLPYVFNNMVLN